MNQLEQKLNELQQAYDAHSKAVDLSAKALKDAETKHRLGVQNLPFSQTDILEVYWKKTLPSQDTSYSQMQLSKKGTQVVFKNWPNPLEIRINQVIKLEDVLSQNPAFKEFLVPDRQTLIETKEPLKENLASLTVVPHLKREQLESTWEDVKKLSSSDAQEIKSEIDARDGKLLSEVSTATAALEQKKKEFEEFKKNYEPESLYLSRILPTARKTPDIAKDKNSRFDEKPFYSLWIGDSPVFLYDGTSLHYLHTNKKDKPLESKRANADSIINRENKNLAEKLLGLKPGAFCDVSGYVLTGQHQEIASKIFEHVFTGVEILPNEDSPGGYEAKEPKKDTRNAESSIQPRHWSQAYLAEKQPTTTVLGQLLGSGGSYKAYQYGDKTVVEFDQEGHATYLFDTKYFENLRTWQKTILLESRPEGFQGRLIHKEERNEWMKSIDDFIKSD